MISTDIWRAAIPGSTIITCFGRPEDRPVPRIGKRLRVNAGVITNDTRDQNRLDRAIVPCSTAAGLWDATRISGAARQRATKADRAEPTQARLTYFRPPLFHPSCGSLRAVRTVRHR